MLEAIKKIIVYPELPINTKKHLRLNIHFSAFFLRTKLSITSGQFLNDKLIIRIQLDTRRFRLPASFGIEIFRFNDFFGQLFTQKRQFLNSYL